MELVANKGLIVDYSLEDVRVLHKREVRLDKQKKLVDEKKREQKKEAKAEVKASAASVVGTVVDLGKKSQKSEKPQPTPIDQITDLEALHRM